MGRSVQAFEERGGPGGILIPRPAELLVGIEATGCCYRAAPMTLGADGVYAVEPARPRSPLQDYGRTFAFHPASDMPADPVWDAFWRQMRAQSVETFREAAREQLRRDR